MELEVALTSLRKSRGVTQTQIAERLSTSRPNVSRIEHEDDLREFGQLIADEQAESPYERAVETLANEALRSALERLSYRQRRILELRYGLDGTQPRTLDQVGRTFNVTRERIRQIENDSLQKLRHIEEAQILRSDCESPFEAITSRFGHSDSC